MNLIFRIICLFFLFTLVGGYALSINSDDTSVYFEQLDDTQKDSEDDLGDSPIALSSGYQHLFIPNTHSVRNRLTNLRLRLFLLTFHSRSPPQYASLN